MLNVRFRVMAGVAFVAAATSLSAQPGQRYTVPRTEHGHPDFQGAWATAFLTMLERPKGVESLTVNAEQARTLVNMIRGGMPAVIDPDFQIADIRQLALVNGDYRTSIIVDPKDGRMPFTQAGLDLAMRVGIREDTKFDHIEERPLAERCLENLGFAPIRTLPVLLPRQIVQTRDHVLIMSEDTIGLRTIRLGGPPPTEIMRSVQGYSVGHWEKDTLVVETTHFRDEDPARTVLGRPLLLSRNSKVTERFTRLSNDELFYQFTVDDRVLYQRPWSGEFSLQRHDGPLYEYACHEGNYSLPAILRGGQATAK